MLTVDAHIDLPYRWWKNGLFDLREPSPHGMVDIPRMVDGGLDCFVAAVYLPDRILDKMSKAEIAMAVQDQYNQLLRQEGVRIAMGANNAITIKANGNVPIFVGMESGRLLAGEIGNLTALADAGLQYLTLCHNRNNDLCDSATDHVHHGGLGGYGEEVVRECERLGVLVDVSHASKTTIDDVIAGAQRPIIASHSGCKAVTFHERNLASDQIESIAHLGGVVCVPFARRFVESRAGVINHINYIVQQTGTVNNVGIGSDLDGAVMVEGLEDVSRWRWVMDELANHGYTDEGIAAICGGNLLRMFA